jgi:hypothetical protein
VKEFCETHKGEPLKIKMIEGKEVVKVIHVTKEGSWIYSAI